MTDARLIAEFTVWAKYTFRVQYWHNIRVGEGVTLDKNHVFAELTIVQKDGGSWNWTSADEDFDGESVHTRLQTLIVLGKST